MFLRDPSLDQLLADIREKVGALPVMSAENMARATYEALLAGAERAGQDPKREVAIYAPGTPCYLGTLEHWVVAWEAGPYEWAIPASSAIGDVASRIVEPYYSFDLCFYPTEDNF
jgi:hypothetical protein